MLILTRKESQKIYLNDNIIITIAKIQGDKVRIGIEAPREITVLREELVKEKT